MSNDDLEFLVIPRDENLSLQIYFDYDKHRTKDKFTEHHLEDSQ